MSNPIQVKFAEARVALNNSLIEREDEIDLILTGLVANEHVLFVGAPGVAKSRVAESVFSWIADANQFNIQLHKHTAPEEIFGTLDMSAFKDSRYKRNTKGYLPEATHSFTDEVFKCSAATLGTLLKIKNERIFRNDATDIKVPLRCNVSASNEYPKPEDNLSALFDRYVVRKNVKAISTAKGRQDYIERTIAGDSFTPKFTSTITVAELDQATRESKSLPFPTAAVDAYKAILQTLAGEGIIPSDRRQGKAISVVRAYAYIKGHTQVEVGDLEVLAHVLWDDPQEQPAKVAQVVGKIANPVGQIVNSLLLEIEQITLGLNPKNPAQLIPAIGKLREIGDKLNVLAGGARLDKAKTHLKNTVNSLLASQKL